MSSDDWVAWTAIGTLALAGATVAAIIVTSVQAGRERKRADAGRLAEIKHDNEKRAEDRERDDRLRREAAEERNKREAAEQRATEDYEARQVVMKLEEFRDLSRVQGYPADTFSHRIDVSTPNAYPIKQVDGQWVLTNQRNFSIVDFGLGIGPPTVEDDRTTYSFRARIPVTDPDAVPIIRFVDWRGNLYFQYKHYTERFPQNTDFHDAAVKIDKWIRTGPNPD